MKNETKLKLYIIAFIVLVLMLFAGIVILTALFGEFIYTTFGVGGLILAAIILIGLKS